MAKKQTFIQMVISAGLNLHPSEFEAGIQAGMQIVKENKKKREGLTAVRPRQARGTKPALVAGSSDVDTADEKAVQ